MVPLFWPLKVATLPMRGLYLTLEGELPITLRLLNDAALPKKQAIQIRLPRRPQ